VGVGEGEYVWFGLLFEEYQNAPAAEAATTITTIITATIFAFTKFPQKFNFSIKCYFLILLVPETFLFVLKRTPP